MKIKLTPLYLLAFFLLVFLIGEMHDWAHFFIGRWVCGCWGTREFDSWALCSTCKTPGRLYTLAWVGGPLINYLAMWTGWNFMHPENTIEQRSLGFSLVFAALPLTRIISIFSGSSDESDFFGMGFLHPEGDNQVGINAISLLFVMAICLPILHRALMILPEWKMKIQLFPAFLALPPLINQLVRHWLNGLQQGLFRKQYVTGVPFALLGWLFILLLILAVTWKSLMTLFEHKDLAL